MEIVIGIVCLVVGALVTYFVVTSGNNSKVQEANKAVEDAREQAERIASDARHDAETAKKAALVEAREEILQLKQKSESDEKKRKQEIQKLENRIMQREESLDRRNDALDRKEHQLSSLQGQLDKRKNEVDQLFHKQTSELERIADLTKEDAHQELLDRVRSESVRDEAQILRESEQRVRAQADKTAREIVSTAIQRCAADQAGEITVTLRAHSLRRPQGSHHRSRG
jgi:ribonuclease Y